MEHREIYMEHFRLGPDDFAPCEITGGPGRDVHHILGRIWNEAWDKYGITDANDIRNLMFLSRHIHTVAGQNERYNEWLFKQHALFMEDGLSSKERDYADPLTAELVKGFIENQRGGSRVHNVEDFGP